MRSHMLILLLVLIVPPIWGIWSFWKDQIWKRKLWHAEDYTGAGVFVSLLGYPSNCELKGTSHSCRLSVACWWGGGSSQTGCGSSPWLVGCCVPKTKVETIISQSMQRRNDILDDVDEECGISNDRVLQKRIVGGKQATFGQFPWQAYIKISAYQCGGVLVSRKYVATAAHCILPAKLSEILIYLGELDNTDSGDVAEPEPAELHRVKNRLIHPNFLYKATQPDRFDLALLQLKTQAGYSYHIVPICLPDSFMKLTGRQAVVAGWGKTDPMSKTMGTNVLRSVTVPILDIRECMEWHRIRQIVVDLHQEMLCAGHKLGKHDACLGDSGGPLIVLENGRWTLVGITSAGFGCGEPHQPGIYHKVSTSVDWIRSIIYRDM